jgi:hypothetical protein
MLLTVDLYGYIMIITEAFHRKLKSINLDTQWFLCPVRYTHLVYLSETKQLQHTLPNSIQSEHSSYSYTYAEYAMPEEGTVILDK